MLEPGDIDADHPVISADASHLSIQYMMSELDLCDFPHLGVDRLVKLNCLRFSNAARSSNLKRGCGVMHSFVTFYLQCIRIYLFMYEDGADTARVGPELFFKFQAPVLHIQIYVCVEKRMCKSCKRARLPINGARSCDLSPSRGTKQE